MRIFFIAEGIFKLTVSYSESCEVLLSTFNYALFIQFAYQDHPIKQILAIYLWIFVLDNVDEGEIDN